MDHDYKTDDPDLIAQAIFTVNKHAKTAPDSRALYDLKKAAIEKLILEKKARKIGLQFSRNPGLSQQRSDLLIECGRYQFHIPPQKSDFQELPHLGKLSDHVRNPKTRMSLKEAKLTLQAYTGHKVTRPNEHRQPAKYQKPVFKRLGE
ncbi:YkyB family protein [Jeotgalibacillus aurantiacus]|uniref:YkyB family protein n=1 Tax=Jeotgalibacillus aurantiacus TaxID=2763266 RepID=UPI001D0B246F|nr:YkyB family protein [Jeotgalibacillus aurantiacus]